MMTMDTRREMIKYTGFVGLLVSLELYRFCGSLYLKGGLASNSFEASQVLTCIMHVLVVTIIMNIVI